MIAAQIEFAKHGPQGRIAQEMGLDLDEFAEAAVAAERRWRKALALSSIEFLGDSLAVEQRPLTPRTVVRIHVPQPLLTRCNRTQRLKNAALGGGP